MTGRRFLVKVEAPLFLIGTNCKAATAAAFWPKNKSGTAAWRLSHQAVHNAFPPTPKLRPSLFQENSDATVPLENLPAADDGRAEIQVWLTDKSEEAIAQLKQLGFEVVLDPKTAKLVIGRLPIEKLEALAALAFVRYVAPQLPAGSKP